MSEETQQEIQPQPMPQPVPTPEVAPQPAQLNYVPAIQGVQYYFSIGQNQGRPQLYSYDVTLQQWRIAQDKEVENVMISLGVPANVLNAMKNFRL